MEVFIWIRAIAMGFWLLVALWSVAILYFLYFRIGYLRIFKEPGEKGRWTPILTAAITGIFGFVMFLVIFY